MQVQKTVDLSNFCNRIEPLDHSDRQCHDASALAARAGDAATFLKALGHDGRLMILCHLTSGPKSVTELENLLSSRQAVVSQQLARLRFEGLVSARREGQAIFYSILDPKVHDALEMLERLFIKPRIEEGERSHGSPAATGGT